MFEAHLRQLPINLFFLIIILFLFIYLLDDLWVPLTLVHMQRLTFNQQKAKSGQSAYFPG